jgi:hypothetical protein
VQELIMMLNEVLDQIIRPHVEVVGHKLSAFQVFGYLGLAAAVTLSLSLVAYLGLALWVMAVIILAAVATFFLLALLTKTIVGEEQLTYYHHEIMVMVVAALLLRLLRQPAGSFLDATILGIGTFLVWGRIGCLMVGCCHGRPCRWGVRYGAEHQAVGFAPCYVGVRLFPIQIIELLWVACLVLVGSFLVVGGSPPGAALAGYVVAYSLGRFCFEFARGDRDRHYLWGFSEAQWISLLLMVGVVGAGWLEVLPWHGFHLVGAVALVLTMCIVASSRRLSSSTRHRLLNPHHLHEMAMLLKEFETPGIEPACGSTLVRIGGTSLGVQLSTSSIPSPAGEVAHYTFSSKQGVLSKASAELLAKLIRRLNEADGASRLIECKSGIFHLVIQPIPDQSSRSRLREGSGSSWAWWRSVAGK